jgi:hypothetical protein
MALRREREDWIPAFSKLGIGRDEVLTMSATDFINRRDYLESEGFRSGPLPPVDEAKMEKMILRAIKFKAQTRRTEPPRLQPQPGPHLPQVVTEQRELLQQQDTEYAALLERVQNAPLRPNVEVEHAPRPLPPEPEDGVLIAVALPSRKKITRKFDKDATGGDILSWVGTNNEMSSASFELRLGTGHIVDVKKTLVDQGIATRTLLNAVIQK